MKDYSKFPSPFSVTVPLHTGTSIYGCQRLQVPLDLIAFDPRCEDCMAAAVGYLDSGQDYDGAAGVFFPDNYSDPQFICNLQEFVEWVQYYKGVKV